MNKTNVLIAFGGVSPEHEVSVITGIQAASALDNNHYNLIPLYISKSGRFLTGSHLLELETYKDLAKAEVLSTPCAFHINNHGTTILAELESKGLFAKKINHTIDVLITAFHGSDGENGNFQGLCEQFNIPYTGSGPLASSMGMDKFISKKYARTLNIPVVDDILVIESEWVKNKSQFLNTISDLGETVFIKPVHLGSSIGVHKATGKKNIEIAIETGFRYDDQLIVEKAVFPLMEINCSVLGDYDEATASVCEQPLGSAELLTFEDKYLGGSGKGMASATRIIPAPISEELTKQIQESSVKLFKSMNAGGVARLDFLVNTETNTFYFNEINTIPGSFSYYLWDKSGISFTSLLQKLIELAQKKHRNKNGRVRSFETNLLSQKAVTGIKGLKGKG